jgi:hypothetical protein
MINSNLRAREAASCSRTAIRAVFDPVRSRGHRPGLQHPGVQQPVIFLGAQLRLRFYGKPVPTLDFTRPTSVPLIELLTLTSLRKFVPATDEIAIAINATAQPDNALISRTDILRVECV